MEFEIEIINKDDSFKFVADPSPSPETLVNLAQAQVGSKTKVVYSTQPELCQGNI